MSYIIKLFNTYTIKENRTSSLKGLSSDIYLVESDIN
jgi:hypothetical protein